MPASGWLCFSLAAACIGLGGAGLRPATAADEVDRFAQGRTEMLERQLKERGIRDPEVLRAMNTVPREEFVPAAVRERAYDDSPLPIGYGQTISQPYIVAFMTELARVGPGDVVLDIGTGSGYQAAVLAEIVDRVYSIEIIPELAEEATERLGRLGYDTVTVREGDGWKGWPEHAPFDAIIVAAAPETVPEPLIDQLKPGARLILPVGDVYQELVVITRRKDGSIDRESVAPVRFVPMTGIAQDENNDTADR